MELAPRKTIVFILMIFIFIFIFIGIKDFSSNTVSGLDSLKEMECKGNPDLYTLNYINCDDNLDICSEEDVKEWEDAKKYLGNLDCSKLDSDDDDKNDCSCIQKKIYFLKNEKRILENGDNYNSLALKDCSITDCNDDEKKVYDSLREGSKDNSDKFYSSNFYREHHLDFENYAKSKSLDEKVLYAIIIKEGAYNKDFKDSVRFECSYFNRKSDKKVQCTLKDGESFSRIKSETDYNAYLRAKELDPRIAFESSSFGFAQIMGFNYVDLGYSSFYAGLQEMDFRYEFEYFKKFLEKRGLIEPIRNKNWGEIARLYNGEGYKQNNYDLALKENYNSLEEVLT